MDQETETDALNFSSITGYGESTNSCLTILDPYADTYDMNHYRRGTAIIFSHLEYDIDLMKREGTAKDEKDLEKVLKLLKFDVTIYNDLKYEAIYEVIHTLSKSDHSDVDCLLIAVMTHGDRGKIYARDRWYPPNFLWNSFSGDKCPGLVGKPKLFFVQACRGNQTDNGTRIRSRIQCDAQASGYTIPVMADILVMYSCYDGYLSWRCPHSGSWFIQSLCEELRLRSRDTDLLTLLTFLNRRMAISYKSISPNRKEMHEKKQIGTIVSTLTRLLYFYPK
ncbi:hypothetical protein RI129_011162 [Pyrocoelia pectoralis]|uniref:Caspase-1 n=1 Tax=Pyrocoelia pectoralis TaxID=417401 RepID=A0AAN7V8D7_9COLE